MNTGNQIIGKPIFPCKYETLVRGEIEGKRGRKNR